MTAEEKEDEENTPLQRRGKKGEGRMASTGKGKSGRRLSSCGSKSRPHYLKEIANRFQRKGRFGRGRITVHRPLLVDVSRFSSISGFEDDGWRRKSFIVFDDGVSPGPAHSQFPAVSGTKGKAPKYTRAKNATLEGRIMLKWQGQSAGGMGVQQMPTKHGAEDFQAFRARIKAPVATKQQPSLPNLHINCQESGSTNYLKRLAARWQRGGRGILYTKPTPLDKSELEEKFREMDQEDIQGKEVREKDLREDQELVVARSVSDANEGALEPAMEQVPSGTLPAEPLSSRDWDLTSPGAAGLEHGRKTSEPHPKEKLRKDQEAPLSEASPKVVELGDTPEASDAERALTASRQQTPITSLSCEACNLKDSDSLHETDPEKVEWALAQTLETLQVWSIELDPSHRRRESLQHCSCRPSPWLKRTALSVIQSPSQLADTIKNNARQPSLTSVNHNDRALQPYVDKPSSPMEAPLPPHEPAIAAVETHEGRFLQTASPPPGTVDNIKFPDNRPLSPRDCNGADGPATQDSLKHRSGKMASSSDSMEILSIMLSPGPDHQNPASPHVGIFNKEILKSDPESPPGESAEPLREADYVAATPPPEQTTLTPPRTSPTPPTDPLSVYGYPYRREELGQKWLRFCSPPPPCLSGVGVETQETWTVESGLVRPTSLEPEEHVHIQQAMPATTPEDALPVAAEEAASSEHNNDKAPLLTLLGLSGGSNYADDVDDVSNDAACIVPTGDPSAHKGPEGTSALKEKFEEDASPGKDVFCIEATPVEDVNASKLPIDPVEYPLTLLDEEHIEQFINSLQATPGVSDSPAEELETEGDEGGEKEAMVKINDQSSAGEAEQGTEAKEQATPVKEKGEQSAQVQGERTPTPQQTKAKRARNRTKTTKADSPLDAGSNWSNGQRKSTRIKSKPLEWWRGEKMLYGRVHSTLNTLIGIKHRSPNPVWPKPQGRQNKAPRNYRVDSFVPAKYNALIRLAAQ